MDFGIAARMPTTATRRRPRSSARRATCRPKPRAASRRPPAMDVFAAGVMLGELLGGEPLLREPTRTARSSACSAKTCRCRHGVGGRRRRCARIVQRALARDAGAALRQRARAARRAGGLAAAGRRRPATGAAGGSQRDARIPAAPHAPQERLPGAVRLGRRASSAWRTRKTRSLRRLSRRDPEGRRADQQAAAHGQHGALQRGGGGGISTVSRAVALVGFAGIRNMALSAGAARAHARQGATPTQLKEEFLRALMAGTLAERADADGARGARRPSSARCSRTSAAC